MSVKQPFRSESQCNLINASFAMHLDLQVYITCVRRVSASKRELGSVRCTHLVASLHFQSLQLFLSDSSPRLLTKPCLSQHSSSVDPRRAPGFTSSCKASEAISYKAYTTYIDLEMYGQKHPKARSPLMFHGF